MVPLRGNVDTRLRKLDDGEADAIVLAAAGLHPARAWRRGSRFLFDPAEFVPEAGQGALAVQVRAGEEELVAALDHGPSRAAGGGRAGAGGRAGRRLHGAGGCARLARGRASFGMRSWVAA